MKISVDTDRCQGHTLCAMTAPDLFDLHEQDGHAIVKPADGLVPTELELDAIRAGTTCPEQAITIDE